MVGEYNYLGVLFSSSSLFPGMASRIVHRASVATGTVLSTMTHSRMSSWSARQALYNSIIVGSISHCLAAWALRYLDIIERVQVRFFKTLLHLPRSTADSLIRHEVGVLPLSFHVLEHALNWICKLLRMNSSRIPRICFNRLLNLENEDSRYNWTLQMKKIFSELGLQDTWAEIQTASFDRERSQIILERYSTLLYDRDVSCVSRSSYCVFYHSFVSPNLHPAEYLTWQLPIFMIRIIAQLRLCTARNIKFTLRGNTYTINFQDLCSLCNLGKNESLVHVMSECPIYNCIRTNCMKELGYSELQQALADLTPQKVKKIAYFISSMLKIRSFMLNE